MTYLTSWDINFILCLLTFDIPWSVINLMAKRAKRIHRDYILEKTREFHCEISPSMIYSDVQTQWKFPVLAGTPNKKFIGEFKLAWRWRCPEIRKDIIVRTIIFDGIREFDRLKYDFDPFNGPYKIDSDKDRPKKGRYYSSEGLWDVSSAWGDYHNKDRQVEFLLKIADNGWLVTGDRNKYIANWYKNIHEGRYFLFFQENNITNFGRRKSKDIKLLEKVKRFDNIHSVGPFQQMAEDLLVIDGPGLGKKCGSKIEHIDDIFVV